MMTEKAARIAELEREIETLEAANEATPTWGAAVGARWESIKGLSAELAHLRNEQPKEGDAGLTEAQWLTNMEEQRPAMEAAEVQFFDELKRRKPFEEALCVAGYGQRRAAYIVSVLADANLLHALPQGEGSEPVGWDLATLHDLAIKEYKTACEVYSSDHETALLTVVDEIIYRLRGSASSPPLPAGNADPRVREALDEESLGKIKISNYNTLRQALEGFFPYDKNAKGRVDLALQKIIAALRTYAGESAAQSERAGLERAAAWHEEQAKRSWQGSAKLPDYECHVKSAKAIRALSATRKAGGE